MSQATPSGPQPSTTEDVQQRKGPPVWGVVAFLIVLGGLLILNQLVSHSGPEIHWIEGDLDQALELAAQGRRRVFLYVYQPDDPMHARNEREVFSRRWAREPLANVVCCRLRLEQNRALGDKYRYEGTPLLLLLDAQGNVQGRVDGVVEERQFRTYIGDPARRLQ